jgi:hypothetical protein
MSFFSQENTVCDRCLKLGWPAAGREPHRAGSYRDTYRRTCSSYLELFPQSVCTRIILLADPTWMNRASSRRSVCRDRASVAAGARLGAT